METEHDFAEAKPACVSGFVFSDLNDNGIPDDYPTRVIREDPEREGLLYAGCEFGLFVSFAASSDVMTPMPRAISLVRTPYRSSIWTARAWATSVGEGNGRRKGATSDQRPAALGGPDRVTRPGRRARPDRRPDPRASARTGASESLVTSPAHARSHSAASTASWS